MATNTGPFFADIDADGQAEIIQHWTIDSPPNSAIRSGVSVYNAVDGTIKWEYLGPREGSSGDNQVPLTVVDLDLDGTMEIISHNSVISHLGTLEFTLPTEPTYSGRWTFQRTCTRQWPTSTAMSFPRSSRATPRTTTSTIISAMSCGRFRGQPPRQEPS